MLDFRLETFLELCNTKNYTKAAKKLCITQPAVTQHIKYIESKYNIKLFTYAEKKLSLTKSGEEFFNNIIKLKTFSLSIENNIQSFNTDTKSISFGATRTIGEFFLPSMIKKYVTEFPLNDLSVVVENTSTLLNMLEEGIIEFALVEGHFNKSDYETHLISKEEFVIVISPNNPLAKKSTLTINDLFTQNLIIREKGSGSREIFDLWLYERGYSYNDFYHFIELGNINLIKNLIKDNLGVSLMYKKAIEKELNNNELIYINIDKLNLSYEFNFIFLKNSIFAQDYLNFYKYITN